MNTRMVRRALCCLVMCALVAAGGCRKSAEEVPERIIEESAAAMPESDIADENEVAGAIVLTAATFAQGADIPVIHARPAVEGGANVSIPYEWTGVPDGTRSLALVLVDVHPMAGEWIHWLVVEIPPDSVSLPEGASRIEMPDGARELTNTFGDSGYDGPQPPAGSGDHEYRATIYALDLPALEIGESPDHATVLAAMKGHILAQGSVSGFFGR